MNSTDVTKLLAANVGGNNGGANEPGHNDAANLEERCTYQEPGSYQRTDIQAMLREAQALCEKDPEAFTYDDLITVQAPMVRCSRPPFRKLCRLWGTKVNYTHMIMSESFAQSANARASDFAIYEGENMLITQIAGTNVSHMTATAKMVAPYCDYVDINCGCPQKWAMKEGIGSAMLEKPELTAEIVKSIVTHSGVPCVVKMRVYDDVRKSVDFARAVEAAGASWVTVHGRTPWSKPDDEVRTKSIVTVKESLSVPVVANGSVESVDTALALARACGVGGVMSGRGVLNNPASFDKATHVVDPNAGAGIYTSSYVPANFDVKAPLYEVHPPRATPYECVSDFVRLSAVMDLPMKAFAHHVLLMANDLLSPAERNFLGQQKSFVGIVKYLRQAGVYVDEGRFQLTAAKGAF